MFHRTVDAPIWCQANGGEGVVQVQSQSQLPSVVRGGGEPGTGRSPNASLRLQSHHHEHHHQHHHQQHHHHKATHYPDSVRRLPSIDQVYWQLWFPSTTPSVSLLSGPRHVHPLFRVLSQPSSTSAPHQPQPFPLPPSQTYSLLAQPPPLTKADHVITTRSTAEATDPTLQIQDGCDNSVSIASKPLLTSKQERLWVLAHIQWSRNVST